MKTYDYVSEKVNKGILFSFVAAAVSFLVLIFAVIGLFKSIGAENAVQEIEKNFEEVTDGGKITESGEIAPKTGKSRPLPTEKNFSKQPYQIESKGLPKCEPNIEALSIKITAKDDQPVECAVYCGDELVPGTLNKDQQKDFRLEITAEEDQFPLKISYNGEEKGQLVLEGNELKCPEVIKEAEKEAEKEENNQPIPEPAQNEVPITFTKEDWGGYEPKKDTEVIVKTPDGQPILNEKVFIVYNDNNWVNDGKVKKTDFEKIEKIVVHVDATSRPVTLYFDSKKIKEKQ